jgi:hypothetical protein
MMYGFFAQLLNLGNTDRRFEEGVVYIGGNIHYLPIKGI